MLLPALAREGLDVRFLALESRSGDGFVHAMREAGVAVTPLPIRGDVDPGAARRIAGLIHRLRPAIVHTHLIHADLYGQVAAMIRRVPAVSSVHSTHGFYRHPLFKRPAQLGARIARRTVAISDHVGDFLQASRIVPPDRLRVIKYGIDLGQWAPATGTGSNQECVIASAARFVPGKGLDFLIEGFGLLAKRGVSARLVIAGDGPERSRLEGLAGRVVGGDATVEFPGFLDDVRPLLGRADVFVFPTTTFPEGFGLSALEAMAIGLPVVATRVASLPEIVQDGVTGRLVDPESPAELADALTELARNSELRAAMGKAGRQRAEAHFSLDRMTREIIDLYHEVLR